MGDGHPCDEKGSDCGVSDEHSPADSLLTQLGTSPPHAGRRLGPYRGTMFVLLTGGIEAAHISTRISPDPHWLCYAGNPFTFGTSERHHEQFPESVSFEKFISYNKAEQTKNLEPDSPETNLVLCLIRAPKHYT